MSDQHLRDLERRALQGELEATVELLRERIRCGLLIEERVRLAAHLGDKGARIVCPAPPTDGIAHGCECPTPPGTFCIDHNLEAYLEGITSLDEWETGRQVACINCSHECRPGLLCKGCMNGCLHGRVPETSTAEVMKRCAIAATSVVRHQGVVTWFDSGPVCERQHCRDNTEALLAAKAWLACPCDKHERACGALYDTVKQDSVWHWLLRSINGNWGLAARKAIQAAASHTDQTTIREAIKKDVVSWLLS